MVLKMGRCWSPVAVTDKSISRSKPGLTGKRQRPTEELILNVNKMLRFANDLAVRSLDTMLVQNSTAPIIAAAHNLRPDSPLLSAWFGR